MELLKVSLDFISSMAYPMILGIFFILFRRQVSGILEIAGRVLNRGGVKIGDFTISADQAADIVQELLTPAAPLALGYVENFINRFYVDDKGKFKYVPDKTLSGFHIAPVFTIYIPQDPSLVKLSSQSLIHDEYKQYGEKNIKNIDVESKTGRSFTGFGVLQGDTLYPVDVPMTLISIQHVFEYRGEQLKLLGHLDAQQIENLRRKNLDEFAKIISDETKCLQRSGIVRVVRTPEALFQ